MRARAYWREGLASHVMRRRRALGTPNTALHIKHCVPACSEVERLRLIGASLDRADGANRACNTEPELLAAWPAAEAAMEFASALASTSSKSLAINRWSGQVCWAAKYWTQLAVRSWLTELTA